MAVYCKRPTKQIYSLKKMRSFCLLNQVVHYNNHSALNSYLEINSKAMLFLVVQIARQVKCVPAHPHKIPTH
jgi:hypothetical protein